MSLRSTTAVLLSLLLALVTGCASARAEGTGFASALPSAPTISHDDPRLPAGDWNKEARADQQLGAVGRTIGLLRRDLERARAERDVVKVTCLNDKLTQASALEDHARRNRSAVRMALLDGDTADGPYALVAADGDRARALLAEARQCVGEELVGGRVYTVADHDADGIPDRADARAEVYAMERSGPDGTDGATDAPPVDERRLEIDGKRSANLAKEVPVLALKPGPQPAQTTPLAQQGQTAATPTTQTAQAEPRKAMLIRTAEIALAVYEVEKNLDAVEKTATELGGYLAMRSDRQITVRVPRESFDALVAKVERMGDVLHKNVAAEDVTDQWVDVEMRPKNALAVRARLEKLLEGATVRDAVEIHKELSKVTEEIERLQGKLKLLGDRVAYSTVTVSFEPVASQQVRSQALLPFPWMNTIGLGPLLRVAR